MAVDAAPPVLTGTSCPSSGMTPVTPRVHSDRPAPLSSIASLEAVLPTNEEGDNDVVFFAEPAAFEKVGRRLLSRTGRGQDEIFSINGPEAQGVNHSQSPGATEERENSDANCWERVILTCRRVQAGASFASTSSISFVPTAEEMFPSLSSGGLSWQEDL